MFIKIKSVPMSQAPEWVRRAWIGLVMPVRHTYKGSSIPILSVKKEELEDWYQVNSSEALDVLKEKNMPAYDWWVKNWPSPTFMFNSGCCQLID